MCVCYIHIYIFYIYNIYIYTMILSYLYILVSHVYSFINITEFSCIYIYIYLQVFIYTYNLYIYIFIYLLIIYLFVFFVFIHRQCSDKPISLGWLKNWGIQSSATVFLIMSLLLGRKGESLVLARISWSGYTVTPDHVLNCENLSLWVKNFKAHRDQGWWYPCAGHWSGIRFIDRQWLDQL